MRSGCSLGTPSNYDLLGQYFMWDAQNPQAASVQFRQAVSLNPYASSYWLHLAQSEYSLGNDSEQASAIEQSNRCRSHYA